MLLILTEFKSKLSTSLEYNGSSSVLILALALSWATNVFYFIKASFPNSETLKKTSSIVVIEIPYD